MNTPSFLCRVGARIAAGYIIFVLSCGSAFAQFGVTTGVFQVSALGAAQFSVPLELPPAVHNGLAPQLSLEYDSHRRSGLMGLGWQLGGLPTIAVCPYSIAQDGIIDRPSISGDLRYCLNGERLVGVAGTYGADGAEYRTERDSFSKIVSHRRQGATGAPDWFEVHTRAGLLLEFGSIPDGSATVRVGPYAYQWALNRAGDQLGNYYTVKYANTSYANASSPGSVDDGVFYPTEIAYTGNTHIQQDGQPAPALVTVQFTYVPRPAGPLISYLRGRPRFVDRLLASITARDMRGPKPISVIYDLHYSYQSDSSVIPEEPKLTSIAHCFTSLGYCQPALQFTWEPGDMNALVGSPFDIRLPGVGGSYAHYFLDAAGAGRQAWLMVAKATDEAWIADTGAGGAASLTWARVPGQVGAVSEYEHLFGDVNGDGRDDWVRIQRTTGAVTVALSLGGNTFGAWTAQTPVAGIGAHVTHRLADVDGDGLADLVEVNDSVDSVRLAKSSPGGLRAWDATLSAGFADVTQWETLVANTTANRARAVVRIGCSVASGGQVVSVLDAHGLVALGQQSMSPCRNDFSHAVFDVNGDGIDDLIEIRPFDAATNEPEAVLVAAGRGDGSFQMAPMWSAAARDNGLAENRFADFTGNGTTSWLELIVGRSDATTTPLFRIRGDLAMNANNIPAQVVNAGLPANVDRFFIDLDGDGRAEWIEVQRGDARATLRAGTGAASDRIVAFADGLGHTTRVTYLPLGNEQVYTADADALYPRRDVRATRLESLNTAENRMQPSMYLVRSVTDGTATQAATTNYSFGGLKSDVFRNTLGFRWMKAERQGGLTSYVTWSQDWPSSGMPLVTETTAGGHLLKRVTNTYACTDFVNAAGCGSAIGLRFFPYVASSSVGTWDLNGALLNQWTTSNQFDSYGSLVRQTTKYADGSVKDERFTITNDVVNWRLGIPIRVERSSTQ